VDLLHVGHPRREKRDATRLPALFLRAPAKCFGPSLMMSPLYNSQDISIRILMSPEFQLRCAKARNTAHSAAHGACQKLPDRILKVTRTQLRHRDRQSDRRLTCTYVLYSYREFPRVSKPQFCRFEHGVFHSLLRRRTQRPRVASHELGNVRDVALAGRQSRYS
jgi:hypothetical protein